MRTRDIPPVKLSKQMLEPVPNKTPGWRSWMERYSLFDSTQPEDANYLRYQKLSRVKLGTVPEAEWGPYLRDLVALEPALIFGDTIGYAGEYPFRL